MNVKNKSSMQWLYHKWPLQFPCYRPGERGVSIDPCGVLPVVPYIRSVSPELAPTLSQDPPLEYSRILSFLKETMRGLRQTRQVNLFHQFRFFVWKVVFFQIDFLLLTTCRSLCDGSFLSFVILNTCLYFSKRFRYLYFIENMLVRKR